MKSIASYLLPLVFISLVISGKSQTPKFSCYITNEKLISPTIYQFDIYLLNTGSVPFQYAGGQYGITINSDIVKGGTLTASVVNGSSLLANVSQENKTVRLQTLTYQLNVAATAPPGSGNGSIISNLSGGCTSPGTKVATFRITNTIPFIADSRINHEFSFIADAGKTATKIHAYVNGINTNVTANGTFYGYNSSGTCLQNIPLNSIQTTVESQASTDFKFIVYPNPATSITKVLFEEKAPCDYILSLMDVTGRKVMIKEGKTEEGENSIKLDLNKLAKGVYQVIFQKNNFTKATKLVVE